MDPITVFLIAIGAMAVPTEDVPNRDEIGIISMFIAVFVIGAIFWNIVVPLYFKIKDKN